LIKYEKCTEPVWFDKATAGRTVGTRATFILSYNMLYSLCMDQDTKSLLEEVSRLEKENNKMLIRLYNIQRWNFISRIIYWLILIGITVGAFYFIKPFMSGLLGSYGLKGASSFNPISSLNSLSELLK